MLADLSRNAAAGSGGATRDRRAAAGAGRVRFAGSGPGGCERPASLAGGGPRADPRRAGLAPRSERVGAFGRGASGDAGACIPAGVRLYGGRIRPPAEDRASRPPACGNRAVAGRDRPGGRVLGSEPLLQPLPASYRVVAIEVSAGGEAGVKA